MTETIKKRGGKREGSGAKPKPPTTAIRVDNRLLDLISVLKSSYTSGIIADGEMNRLIASNLKPVQDSSDTAPAQKELKITKTQLEQRQDKLVETLVKRFGSRDQAKVELVAFLGTAPENLSFRRLTAIDILLIYEWLNETIR